MTAERKYFWKYPRGAVGRLLFKTMLCAVVVAAFLLLSAVGVYAGIYVLWMGGFAWQPALLLIVLMPIFVLSSLLVVRPIPRFLHELSRKRLPIALKAYCRGWSMAIPDPRDSRNRYGALLARHCRQLDQVAEKTGVTPLYEMGIRQANGRESIWFPANTGIETVDQLLTYVRDPNCQIADAIELERELKMLREVLEESDSFHLMLV